MTEFFSLTNSPPVDLLRRFSRLEETEKTEGARHCTAGGFFRQQGNAAGEGFRETTL